MRATEARVFWTPENEEDRYLPEGPRVVPTKPGGSQGALWWLNLQTSARSTHGTLHSRLWDSDGVVGNARPQRLGFLLPTNDMLRLVIGGEKELGVLSYTTGKWEQLITIPDAEPRTIINDGEVLPGGKAIVFGTKDTQFKNPIANLYLYTIDDSQISVLADQMICSNGKVFRTDQHGLWLYDIDTPTRKVKRYRLDLSARTATLDSHAIDLANQIGFPDGMCDCGDGTAIIAFYNPDFAAAGKAIRFDLNSFTDRLIVSFFSVGDEAWS